MSTLELGAVHATNLHGDTVLDVAQAVGIGDVVLKKLVSAGLREDTLNKRGETPKSIRDARVAAAEAQASEAQMSKQQNRDDKQLRRRNERDAAVERTEVTEWLRERDLGYLAATFFKKGCICWFQILSESSLNFK